MVKYPRVINPVLGIHVYVRVEKAFCNKAIAETACEAPHGFLSVGAGNGIDSIEPVVRAREKLRVRYEPDSIS
jgi:hypothetical protein